MAYLAYGIIWISTATAVSFVVYITGDATPLWALFIPGFISLKTNTKGDK